MADGPNVFLEAVVLLGGAAVAAPLFKRIGLGTVLGYLAVGVLLGPVLYSVFGLVLSFTGDGEDVLHVAELGVVMLLFLVGLELKPALLWSMRKEIFGLGATQVIASGLLLMVCAMVAGFGAATSFVIGFGLALSSTAFALQILEEEGDDRTRWGKKAFSILLFQDLAIAPLLVAVPLLAAGTMEVTAGGLWQVAIAISAVVALVLAGLYLMNPLFGIIAATGAREAMIAAALFIVIGSAVLMQYAGLSMAMGAFIAGVLLAESSYRHELEADIEPFRGILLGLFFIAVGLSVDLQIVWDNLLWIALLVPAALALKAAVIYAAARLFGSDHNDSVRMAALLPQHGEFGFVLFSAAVAAGLLDRELSSFLIAGVTLSMALTPLTVMLGQRFLKSAEKEEMDEDFEGAGSSVLMVGFSRMGQIASQTLLAGGCDVTVIDNSADRMRQAERFGFRIYFGDGTRKDVLRAAGIEKAKIVAVCTRDRETTDKIVELIASEYPHAKLFVRSYDRGHAIDLLQRPDIWQVRETFESALKLGGALLIGTGMNESDAHAVVDDVRHRDLARLELQIKEGIMAGRETLHTKPVPEPLVQPRHSRKDHSVDTVPGMEEADGNEPPDADVPPAKD
ncbi:monovalent cation:proton antiporter-2 (CPA2) family protein [Ahrensia sp. R2A130]|uniref:monovalent cation:proton antiporter-2 (CPA2) family protein n=1 Tax=Ahrensia sp. R2A130 TaxID=744979 RepID=UPI0001E0947C|nr:monovalent cation:proton antiporter-2 (CPA2) family protein [Ahrensia sp. R2A130]EFL88569.1 glutathione-regulated potassium-efflux system protein [Ahrensia sp. R2A130]